MTTRIDRGTSPPYSLIQQYEYFLERNPIVDDQFTDSRLKKHLRDKGLVLRPQESRSLGRLEDRADRLNKKQMTDYKRWVAQVMASKLEDIDQLRQGEYRKNLRLWDNKYNVAATRLRTVPPERHLIVQEKRSKKQDDTSTIDSLTKRLTNLQSTIKKSTEYMQNVKQVQVEQDESVVSLQQEIDQIKFRLNKQQSPISKSMPLVEAQPSVDLIKPHWNKYHLSI